MKERKASEFKLKLQTLITEVRELRVQFLEDENYLLQSKHKELKETINCILQAKEAFLNAYQVPNIR
ncbi:hypothetical protein Hanom_Chr12g01113241 [Helianthus anomalus]